MQIQTTLRILGLLLMVFSLTLLPPIGVSFLYADEQQFLFAIALVSLFVIGLLAWFPVRKSKKELRIRDGFVITTLFWVVICSAGAVPLLFANALNMSFIDAIFESVSGLTTTGATVVTNLESLPKSILYYRQQLQWLGGMGIIVLAVAILPMLGIGGMQLYRAETPGPIKDAKLSPRIAETAKALWLIYLSLTIVCAFFYWLSGLNLFDAICHAFSTIAIGGFSTYDNSIGHFNNPAVEWTAIVFMLLAGMNFSLHFVAFRKKTISQYIQDPEWKLYIFIIFGLCFIVVITLIKTQFYTSFDAFQKGIFGVVSIATTTGFITSDFSLWPTFLPVMLIMSAFIGACAGSTGGGIKIIRLLLIFKQANREIQKLIHPSAIVPVKLGLKSVNSRIIEGVWGFIAAYVFLFASLMLLVIAFGEDFITAFSAVGACLNNLGPGLSQVSLNYSSLSPFSKLVLCFAMLLGRLELFTLLVVLSPAFWRH